MIVETKHILSIYLEWVQKICATKNIRINKKITQIVDGNFFAFHQT